MVTGSLKNRRVVEDIGTLAINEGNLRGGETYQLTPIPLGMRWHTPVVERSAAATVVTVEAGSVGTGARVTIGSCMLCWLLWALNWRLRFERSSNRALGKAFASGPQTYPSLSATGTVTGTKVAAAVVVALIYGFPADVVGLREMTAQTGTSWRALETVPDAGVRQLRILAGCPGRLRKKQGRLSGVLAVALSPSTGRLGLSRRGLPSLKASSKPALSIFFSFKTPQEHTGQYDYESASNKFDAPSIIFGIHSGRPADLLPSVTSVRRIKKPENATS